MVDYEISWEERQLVVRSLAIAQTEEKSLRERIQKTSNALKQLKIRRRGKKKLTSSDEWEAAIAAILKCYRTSGLFQIELNQQEEFDQRLMSQLDHLAKC